MQAFWVDFDEKGDIVCPDTLLNVVFEAVIVSVPIRKKEEMATIQERFRGLTLFIRQLNFTHLIFFSSVGIYPSESSIIDEDSYPDDLLEQKLLFGENTLRQNFPQVCVMRLGGLFGEDRVFAKYFQNKPCTTAYQTSNFVHVDDVYRVVRLLMEKNVTGKTLNVVCPEHPLKKDVIIASAEKYGYALPSVFEEHDRLQKRIRPDRLVNELAYEFTYRSPLDF